jgi:hypothetical protein
MLLVECPICATPAAYDTDVDELDCPCCNVRLALAVDVPVAELALAA